MRRYEPREVTSEVEVCVEYTCDGCGIDAESAEYRYLFPVTIEVNYGEEFGTRDEYDYCHDCLMERADLLVKVGSKSELVQPEEP
jgi:hypothetical protein